MYLFFSHLTFNKIISLYAQLQQPTLFFYDGDDDRL